MNFNFTTCNKRRDVGPTQEEIDVCYESTKTKVKILGSGIQKWIVPYKGPYLITAVGASGDITCSSRIGGTGVEYSSLFDLNKNDVLYIIAGQQGYSTGYNLGGSGGGASYVAKKVAVSNYSFSFDNTFVLPLLVAAGGGGAGDCNYDVTPKDGDPGHCETMNDEGGATGQGTTSGGAGFSFDSKRGTTKSFLNGGNGSYQFIYQGCYSYGSFGGGGNADDGGGGGGGYRGGASGLYGVRGMGGYSYNSGKNISCRSRNVGPGYVYISYIGNRNITREKPIPRIPFVLIILLFWK